MASKSVAASIVLLLSLNMLLFSMVNANTIVSANNKPIKCPLLQVCASILLPPFQPNNNCCPLIGGLLDLDAAVCVCAVLKANVGGILKIPLQILLNLQLNACGRKHTDYKCE